MSFSINIKHKETIAKILFLFVFLEIASSLSLFIFKRFCNIGYYPILLSSLSRKHKKYLKKLTSGKTNYIVHSAKLGWTVKKNGFSELYEANSEGIRSSREYKLTPKKNIVRISAFGDSFTHCDDVKNEDTWEEKLNQSNANLEVINFGVTAFGLDQTYLRYKHDGAKYRSDIVFIGFMSENIKRNVNYFRPFYISTTAIPLTKPRFTIQNDFLLLCENPMQKLSQYKVLLDSPEKTLSTLGENDYFFIKGYQKGTFDFLPSIRFYKIFHWLIMDKVYVPKIIENGYYNEESEAFQVTIRLFDKFVNAVHNNKALPIIIIFPNKNDVIRYRKSKTRRYSPLLKYFKNKEYQYIDLLDGFNKYGKEFRVNQLFIFHYSPLGNELAAKHILSTLQEKKILKY